MWRTKYFRDNNLKYKKEYESAEDLALWLEYRNSPNPTYK